MPPLPYPLQIRSHARATRLKLTLRPDKNGTPTLCLTLPRGYPKERALEFVRDQEAWIRARYAAMQSEVENLEAILSKHENEILLWGEWARIEARFRPSREHWRGILQEELSGRLRHWSERMGLYPKSFAIRKSKNRLGSCSRSGKLSFSLQLLFSPKSVLDYLIVHELAHLKHPNHSRDFWNLVARFLPNFEESKRHLRQHHALHLKLQERWF